jgi:hypothetical protein
MSTVTFFGAYLPRALACCRLAAARSRRSLRVQYVLQRPGPQRASAPFAMPRQWRPVDRLLIAAKIVVAQAMLRLGVAHQHQHCHQAQRVAGTGAVRESARQQGLRL